ncbi:MAG TPA: DNA polymerase IV [Cytophagaceae bacterium]|jgi:DNA polymerase-4
MERNIIHMDLDSFFVSVECLRNSKLKGKAIAIGGTGDRGVIASCSYEARKFGVRSAMPVKLAKQLCPQLMVISGDMEQYSKYSQLVTEVIKDSSPLFEKSSIDEFYIDASGMDKYFGCFKWGSELRQRIITETGLPISFGLSVNKMVSKVATGIAKPNNSRHVERGTEKAFLAPLPITKIPMIGSKTASLLTSMGIDRVGTLREMPIDLLQNLLGKNGIELWRRANAIDDTPVVPFSERKSISTENTFSQDTIDIKMLKSLMCYMVEEIAFKLRSEQKMASSITVKIRYSNFDTLTKQSQISYTSSDNVLIPKALELFDKLYDKRMLIRLIGVRLSNLVHGNHQISLFNDTEEAINLCQAMDLIKNKYGFDKINRAVGAGLDSKLKPDTSELTRLRYTKQ